jgi:hypothetical protein
LSIFALLESDTLFLDVLLLRIRYRRRMAKTPGRRSFGSRNDYSRACEYSCVRWPMRYNVTAPHMPSMSQLWLVIRLSLCKQLDDSMMISVYRARLVHQQVDCSLLRSIGDSRCQPGMEVSRGPGPEPEGPPTAAWLGHRTPPRLATAAARGHRSATPSSLGEQFDFSAGCNVG